MNELSILFHAFYLSLHAKGLFNGELVDFACIVEKNF